MPNAILNNPALNSTMFTVTDENSKTEAGKTGSINGRKVKEEVNSGQYANNSVIETSFCEVSLHEEEAVPADEHLTAMQRK